MAWLAVTRLTDAPVQASDDPRKDGKPLAKDERTVSDRERFELLQRAQVWHPPPVAISQARFANLNLDSLSCRFDIDEMGGTTPKFDCTLDSGEEIRVKYGNGPEAPAEAAATRLLRALGFGADEVTLVRHLRCYGCPKEPFSIMKAVEITRTESLYEQVIDYDSYEDFEWVSVERKFDARPVETDRIEGWGFFELDAIDQARGGAPRAQVDALRLVARLLSHWDNKMENQRLVCLDRDWAEGQPCARPFLLLQDVGATFGPNKMEFARWAAAGLWEDRSRCTLSMRNMPFQGATFTPTTITEAGRQFAASLLSQLSHSQLTALFTESRFGEERAPLTTAIPVADWVRVFQEKVRAITEGPPCPQP